MKMNIFGWVWLISWVVCCRGLTCNPGEIEWKNACSCFVKNVEEINGDLEPPEGNNIVESLEDC